MFSHPHTYNKATRRGREKKKRVNRIRSKTKHTPATETGREETQRIRKNASPKTIAQL